MKILIIGNLSDRRCGYQNFTAQMITAFTRAGLEVGVWDGTYPVIYQRQQDNTEVFFPPDVARYDVIQIIWHAATMNHYNGADWAALRRLPGGGPLISWWDGGPSDASCPFIEWMQVKWSDYPGRDGYEHLIYPVPDWIDDLPTPAAEFTVGASSVRGDGIGEIRQICETRGWAMNLPTPGAWLSVEDEIRRLAKSSVNVCWYHTPPIWKARASAPSMLIASRRPLVINRDPLIEHLWDLGDVYHADDLADMLDCLAEHPLHLCSPTGTFDALSWSRATDHFIRAWEAVRG